MKPEVSFQNAVIELNLQFSMERYIACQFPWAAMTNYQNGAAYNRSLFSQKSGVQNQDVVRSNTSSTLKDPSRPFPARCGSWFFLAVAAKLQSLPLSSNNPLPCVSLYLSMAFLDGHRSLDLGSNQIQYDLNLTNGICKNAVSKYGHTLRF